MSTDWYRVAETLAGILGDVISGELASNAPAVVEVLDARAAENARTHDTKDNVYAQAVRMLRNDLFGRGGCCSAKYTQETAEYPCMLPIGHEGAHVHVVSPISKIRWSDSGVGHVTERVQFAGAREAEL